MKSMLRTIFLIVFCTVSVSGQLACRTANFEPGPISPGDIYGEFKNAVVRLQVQGGTDSGTGYLIDASRGYIVTAFHVVKAAQPDTPIEVRIPKSLYGNQTFIANLVKSLGRIQPDSSVGPPDIALLKLQNPSALSGVRPVDISLSYPGRNTPLYSLGFPLLDPNLGNDDLSTQVAQLMMTPNDRGIEVSQPTFGGNSGGPLVDGRGNSVGTCRNVIGTTKIVGEYASTADGEALLDLIPMSDRVIAIDEHLRSGTITEDALSDILTKSSSTPTNMELYAWGRHIKNNVDQYTSPAPRALIPCLMKAFSERELDELATSLSVFADQHTLAVANIHIAESELNRGRPISAEEHINSAKNLFVASNDLNGSIKASFLSAQAKLAEGSAPEAAAVSAAAWRHIKILGTTDKAFAFTTAAAIDLSNGHAKSAVGKYEMASKLLIQNGDLNHSASASLTAGMPKEALSNLDGAVSLYRQALDTPEAAELVYKKAIVQNASGDVERMKETLRDYLALEPEGEHAPEANEILHLPNTPAQAPALPPQTDPPIGI